MRNSFPLRRMVIVSVAVLVAMMFVLPAASLNLSTLRTTHALNGGTSTASLRAAYDVGSFSFYILSVQGSWTVPNIACPTASAAAFYEVAMDVIQTSGFGEENGGGVYLECSAGSALYFAASDQAGVFGLLSSGVYPVHPGDHMHAKISYNPTSGKFTLVLHDSTHVWTYNPAAYTDSHAYRGDAWFTLERSCGTSSCPIPDFGTFRTSSDYVAIAAKQTATTGTKGSLGYWLASTTSKSPYATVYGDTMYDLDTANTLATVSAISSISTGFKLTWQAST
jgi:hypothetical protein